MGRWRIALAFGLIGVMVVALVAVLLAGGEDEPVSAPTTSASVGTTSPSTSTSVVATTTTTAEPVDRIAEVERILEDLELARLVAIYERDFESLARVVATNAGYESAIEAMDTLSFVEDPSRAGIEVTVIEILRDTPDCLVVHHRFDGSQTLGPGGIEEAVRVLWPLDPGGDEYRLVRLWSSPADVWQDDCENLDRSERP